MEISPFSQNAMKLTLMLAPRVEAGLLNKFKSVRDNSIYCLCHFKYDFRMIFPSIRYIMSLNPSNQTLKACFCVSKKRPVYSIMSESSASELIPS